MTRRILCGLRYAFGIPTLIVGHLYRVQLIPQTWQVLTFIVAVAVFCVVTVAIEEVLRYREQLDEIYE